MLGAGGPVGHAYHSGVVRALEEAFHWDAREADLIVGTSAGAQVGALLRAGLSGPDLAARVAGEALSDDAHRIAQHFVRPCPKTSNRDTRRSFLPASPSLFLASLRRPGLFSFGRLLSALLPTGRVCLRPQSEGLRRIFGERWPDRQLWIPSVHLDSGKRVVFGSEDAPMIDVGTAVACSGAVPGVHRPVEWQGLRYVDGGMASATSLDILDEAPVDLVIVSAPLSMYSVMRKRLWRKIRKLERHRPVVALEPSREVMAAMGKNPMAIERAPYVARIAYESTLRELETAAARERFVGAFN